MNTSATNDNNQSKILTFVSIYKKASDRADEIIKLKKFLRTCEAESFAFCNAEVAQGFLQASGYNFGLQDIMPTLTQKGQYKKHPKLTWTAISTTGALTGKLVATYNYKKAEWSLAIL